MCVDAAACSLTHTHILAGLADFCLEYTALLMMMMMIMMSRYLILHGSGKGAE